MTEEKQVEEKKLYVGQREVKDIVENESIDLVGVLYTDETNEDFTTEQWESVKSEEKYDDGLVSLKKYTKLMERITKEMLESRVDMMTQEWLLQRIGQNLVENYKRAVSKLFGVDMVEHTTLAHIEAALHEPEKTTEPVKE